MQHANDFTQTTANMPALSNHDVKLNEPFSVAVALQFIAERLSDTTITLVSTATAGYIVAHGGKGQAAQFAALTHGYGASFKVGAVFLIIGAIVVALTINIGKESLVETEGAVGLH